MIRTWILSTFFILHLTNGLAQKEVKLSPAQSLSLRKTTQGDIDPYKQDLYKIRLTKGQFASIRVNQKSVGLNILVYDPLDSLQQVVDENGIGQDEVVAINATLTGEYKVKVIWNFNRPLSGKYEITLDKLEKTGINTVQRARQLFDSWYEKNSPGGAVVVVKNKNVVIKQTKGLGNVEENSPLTSSSVFEMASCSKQFTGFAVAMLIDRKMISLDDDIRKYLPEMPNYGNVITIGHLVYQTSGIRNTDALEITGVSQEDNITLPMAVRFAASQKQLKFKPGERFSYSNTNYNLLAEIVARVTKQSFSAWTKENIFKPLGMNSTFFKEVPGQVYAHKVLSYKRGRDGFVQRPNNYAATGSAGLCTSLDDLVKWINSLESKQIITPTIDSLLMTTGTLNDGSKSGYGFGIQIGDYHGNQRRDHLGLVIGYRTATAYFPGKNLSIIYLSNDDNDATYQRFFKLRDMFLEIPPEKPSLKAMPNVDEVVARLEKKVITNVDLRPYEGVYYSSELNATLPLMIKNESLVIAHPRLGDINLSNVKDDNFGFIQFARDAAGKVNGLTVKGENIEFRKIE